MIHGTTPRSDALRWLAWTLVLGCALVLSRPIDAPAQDGSASTPSQQPRPDATAGTLFYPTEDGLGYLEAPVLDMDVELRINGIVARAVVRQRFRNPTSDWVEGLYVFPLPERAAVDHLEMRVGDRVIEGRIQERAEARRTYETARSEGKKASLVEQERPNVFTNSIANIGPDEVVEVAIEYQETLVFDAGGFELRFPMVVAPRYVPGSPGSETAASAQAPADGDSSWPDWLPDLGWIAQPRVTPDDGPLHLVNLAVSLDAGFPIASIDCPTHAVVLHEISDSRRELEVHARADRDFVLRWSPERGSEPRAAILSEADDGGGASVLLMVMPPGEEFAVRGLPREVVIVIDTSGSMGGASIRQAREALLLALDRLGPDDWFNVIAFDSTTDALFPDSVRVSADTLDRARDFVRGLEADGGTEMRPALEAGLRAGAVPAGVRQVIFVTDGSVGNEDELFGLLQERLGRSRLFPVGIGSAPNGYLLKRAARFGRGAFTFISSASDVRERMSELFEKLERPALSDVEVHWNDDVEMWPERIPDLYAGEPLIVTARLERFVGDVVVSGRIGDRPWEARLPLSARTQEGGIGKLWARSKIASLMDRSTGRGADLDSIRREVTAVALKHHLVSKFTSLVAVDVTPTAPLGATARTAAVPLNTPRGWKTPESYGALPRGATPAGLWLWLGLLSLAGAAGLRRVRTAR